MAEVVVIGAGIAGLAVAARLAKLRHDVTVLEARAQIGGALNRVEHDGFVWDAGACTVTLPAVVRDLFRKSGRPVEHYLDLQLATPSRRHIFADGSEVDLPTGSRGSQISALDALGGGVGAVWASYVDSLADRWHQMRSLVLDDLRGGERLADRRVARQLRVKQSLADHLSMSLPDDRLCAIAAHGFQLAGHDIDRLPAMLAVEPYVERSFGLWHAAGGMGALVDALSVRMAERDVRVRCGQRVTEILTRDTTVAGVRTSAGSTFAAQVVVATIDPRVVFFELLPPRLVAAGRRAFRSARPVVPPTVTHVGLRGKSPDLPAETVVHGDELIVIRRALASGDTPPSGDQAWTILHRSLTATDVLASLAGRGLDVRPLVVTQLTRTPGEILAQAGGSPYGLQWNGWRTHARRSAAGNPLTGLHLIGASMHPGSSVPYTAWGAAHVAELVGKA